MENSIMEQLRLILDKVDTLPTRQEMDEKMSASETRLKIYMEHTVSDKIKALFDGYKSALENQASLTATNQLMLREIDELKTRVTVLENRTA